ncbi:MAG: 2OG-Fe(II) oxygenase family protein [Gammaproteobacteria bacterium]|nr:2OG-Fe(II) oxygenase family protein [Gammaproteobacteria bacterium]NNE05255.1 hypothetical protein [Xanthomonadales bacterium]
MASTGKKIVRPPFVVVRNALDPELNQRLKAQLLELSKSESDAGSNKPSGKSFFDNKWLSRNDLHQRGFADFNATAQHIERLVNGVARSRRPLAVNSMWAIVSRSGMAGKRHMHTDAMSIAYYVDPGRSGNGNGGEICFYADAGDRKKVSHMFVPEYGAMVMFPSRMFHSVNQYESSQPRIVISANLA